MMGDIQQELREQLTEKDCGGPAFPFGQTDNASGQLVNGWGSEGMTLRDYFAAKAMALAATRHTQHYVDRDGHVSEYLPAEAYQQTAEDSYAIADAMLAARKQ